MCLITKNARNNAKSLCKCVSEYLCNRANTQANRVFVSALVGTIIFYYIHTPFSKPQQLGYANCTAVKSSVPLQSYTADDTQINKPVSHLLKAWLLGCHPVTWQQIVKSHEPLLT